MLNLEDKVQKNKPGVKGPPSVRIAGAILSKPLQAGSKKTRDFFTDKVLGLKIIKMLENRRIFLTMLLQTRDDV